MQVVFIVHKNSSRCRKDTMGDMEMKKSVTARLFREYDVEGKGELSPRQMQSLHEEIRLGGISLGQVSLNLRM